jgi:uncharacterized protein (TIGR00299 family) protein
VTSGGARRIHLDPVGGVAGDMFVAALVDAFPHLRARVLDDCRAVLPEGAGEPFLTEGESGAVRALRFGLAPATGSGHAHEHGHHHAEVHAHSHAERSSGDAIPPRASLPSSLMAGLDPEVGVRRLQSSDKELGHARVPSTQGDQVHAESLGPRVKPGYEGSKGHGSSAEAHAHAEAHDHDQGHGHGAGTYLDMLARIERAKLNPGTARQASAILGIIARAEATIHRVPVEEVHFHEIADWDSLLDVVAAGSLAAALDGAQWTVAPLPLGGGMVKTQHGLLPVPAPATAAILETFDWRDDGVTGERVTPTGAAILRHLAKPDRPASGRLVASGTGAGTRRLPGMPNVLRVLAFEDDGIEADRVTVIEFEIDDMTGEEIGTACELLRAQEGVLDVSLAHRFGKKGRPVVSLRLLAKPEAAEDVARACFAQTSTIGLRLSEARRLTLAREADDVDGVAVKRVQRPGGVTAKAESDALAGATLAERRAAKRRAEQGDE